MGIIKMRIKNAIFLGLVVFCLLGMISAYRSEIRIESVMWDPSHIEAGDDVTIYAKFVNRPIEATWAVEHPDNEPQGGATDVFYKAMLQPADDLSEEYIIIKKEEKNVGKLFVGESWTTPFSIKLKENSIASTYKLRFSVIETDIDGTFEETVKSLEFDLPVRGVVKFDVDAENTVKLGCINDIKIDLENKGLGNAKHVTAKLDLEAPFDPVKTSEIYIGDFPGGAKKELDFKVSVDSETESLTYKIPLTISYVFDNGTTLTESKDIGVRIDEKPSLRVFAVESEAFSAGKESTVTIAVVNEGFVDAKFLRLRLLDGEGYSVEGTSDFYIGNLDSDDSDEEEFTIKIDSTQESGPLALNIAIDYKSANKDISLRDDSNITIAVLSAADYQKTLPATNTTGLLFGVVLIIPALVIAYIVLWLIFKVAGAITGFLNKKFFARK